MYVNGGTPYPKKDSERHLQIQRGLIESITMPAAEIPLLARFPLYLAA